MPLFTPLNFEIAKLVLKAQPSKGMRLDRLLITPTQTFVTDGCFCLSLAPSPLSPADYPDTGLGSPLSDFPPFLIPAQSAHDFTRSLPPASKRHLTPILSTIAMIADSKGSTSLIWTDLEDIRTLPLPTFNQPIANYPSPSVISAALSSIATPVPSVLVNLSLLSPLISLADKFGRPSPRADFSYVSPPFEPDDPDHPSSPTIRFSLTTDSGQTLEAWLAGMRE